jgi:hypothetical protein
MKKLIFIFAAFFAFNVNAQTIIKTGANFNADVVPHKLGKINYPSFELSVERVMCTRFSLYATYNYAKRDYRNNSYTIDYSPFYTQIYHPPYVNYDHTLILGNRFYFKNPMEGFYIQGGIPFTYYTETAHYPEGNFSRSYFAISTMIGAGLKYPLSKKLALEMNFDFSPSFNLLDVDYGTSGFIKSGLKLNYIFNKK